MLVTSHDVTARTRNKVTYMEIEIETETSRKCGDIISNTTVCSNSTPGLLSVYNLMKGLRGLYDDINIIKRHK